MAKLFSLIEGRLLAKVSNRSSKRCFTIGELFYDRSSDRKFLQQLPVGLMEIFHGEFVLAARSPLGLACSLEVPAQGFAR